MLTRLPIFRTTTFEHIGGLDHHIRALKEMIVFPMMYPEVFQRFKVRHLCPAIVVFLFVLFCCLLLFLCSPAPLLLTPPSTLTVPFLVRWTPRVVCSSTVRRAPARRSVLAPSPMSAQSRASTSPSSCAKAPTASARYASRVGPRLAASQPSKLCQPPQLPALTLCPAGDPAASLAPSSLVDRRIGTHAAAAV